MIDMSSTRRERTEQKKIWIISYSSMASQKKGKTVSIQQNLQKVLINNIYLLIYVYKISFGPETMKAIISRFQAQGKQRSDFILIKS